MNSDEELARLIQDENHKIRSLEDEIKKITDFNSKFLRDKHIKEFEEDKLNEQYKDLEKDFESLTIEKDNIDKEETEIHQYIDSLVKEIHELEFQESKYWEELNSFQKKLIYLRKKAQSSENYFTHINYENERIGKMSILDEFFKIEIEKENGKMNGLRFGKLSQDEEINWTETNAVLGNILLFESFMSYEMGIPAIK